MYQLILVWLFSVLWYTGKVAFITQLTCFKSCVYLGMFAGLGDLNYSNFPSNSDSRGCPASVPLALITSLLIHIFVLGQTQRLLSVSLVDAS